MLLTMMVSLCAIFKILLVCFWLESRWTSCAPCNFLVSSSTFTVLSGMLGRLRSPLICASSRRFWEGGKEVFPLSGWRRHFGEAFFVCSSDHAMCFVALLQFRGMTTTQMHFECCSTHSRGVACCFFVFKKFWCSSHRRFANLFTHSSVGRLTQELVVWSRPPRKHRVQDVATCFVASPGLLHVRLVNFGR